MRRLGRDRRRRRKSPADDSLCPENGQRPSARFGMAKPRVVERPKGAACLDKSEVGCYQWLPRGLAMSLFKAFNHVSITVTSMTSCPRPPACGRLFVKDSDGNMLEFIGPTKAPRVRRME